MPVRSSKRGASDGHRVVTVLSTSKEAEVALCVFVESLAEKLPIAKPQTSARRQRFVPVGEREEVASIRANSVCLMLPTDCPISLLGLAAGKAVATRERQ
jgi:hypothetical protein